MNGESGGENRQIKVDSSQGGKTERDSKKIQLFHGEIIQRG
jgi:hypothetical protein